MKYFRSHVLVCVDPECLSKGAHQLMDALNDELVATGLIDEVQVLETSRIGGCAQGPELMVYPEGIHYSGLSADDVPYLVDEHFLKGRIVKKFVEEIKKSTDEELSAPTSKEIRNVLRNCGVIDPENIEDYIAQDGYMALAKVITDLSPEDVLDIMKRSGLRGRGGAGFPTHLKWQFAKAAPSEIKYVCCNADEGDPGAFMNRRVLESDPHSVIEGMVIAAYTIGARYGYVYCRAEYPIAVQTLNLAIKQAKALGLLGENILNSGFSFDLEVRMGAGAFVCGEEGNQDLDHHSPLSKVYGINPLT
jgi:(2Fe-2S) ferredoxin